MHTGRLGAAVAAMVMVIGLGATVASAAEKIRVLIVDGQNNHDMEKTTPWMKKQLELTGHFAVDVSSTPPHDAEADAWDQWRPKFDDYQVVLSNYNGQMWPEQVKQAFESFVSEGGGVVIIHAANNPFGGWKEFDAMIGLGWRGANYGNRIYLDDDGNVVRQPPGEGRGAGHGSHHAFQMITRDTQHPVTEGFPQKWMRPVDELYHGQRGPAKDMHILATAWDDPEQGGSGKHEPLVWWIPYGQGKVFTNLLGHVGRGSDPLSMQCVGFITLLTRSCQWVATNEVTIPVPDNFPTADEARIVDYR